MTTIFWDVDTQVDFMEPEGKRYVPGAEAIRPNLSRLNETAHAVECRVVASADDHHPGDVEISDAPDFHDTFPPHCLHRTPGQARIPETWLRDPLVIEPEDDAEQVLRRVADHDGDILFHKRFFDVFTNPHVSPVVAALRPTEVVLYGVALDVCVRYAVEGLLAHHPNVALTVVIDAVRPIDQRRGAEVLADWLLRGVTIESTWQALGGEP